MVEHDLSKAFRSTITAPLRCFFRFQSLGAQFLDLSLANATDALYNTSGGSIMRDKTGASGPHIGHEFDGYAWYQLNRHVYIGGGIGHLVGGQFLHATTKGPNYNYPYFAINFKDDGGGRN